MSTHTTAHHLLEGLQAIGVSHLFGNLGTDHAPLIEELARWRAEGRTPPHTLLVPHENLAVHMAGGHAIATGQGQAVLVHVDAGTANASMALHNLARMRVPVLLMAGRAPFTSHGELPGSRDTYVHYIQEPHDQASLVRPYVKWEYTLPSGVLAHEALRRAHTLMQSDPRGPAYLMLPREVLAATWPDEQLRRYPHAQFAAASAGSATDEALEEVAARLLAAERPLLITAYAGRSARAVAALEALVHFAGIRVCEFNPLYLNIDRQSPCFAGWQPGRWVAEADVGLMVDVDVPWLQSEVEPPPEACWFQFDVDAVKRDLPMWSFPAAQRFEGDSALMLERLLVLMRRRAGAADLDRAAARLTQLEQEHRARRARESALAVPSGEPGRLNPHHVCAALAAHMQADDIVVSEAIRNTPAVLAQIPRSRPGTLVGQAGGGLGFSSGVALGLKLAHPDRQVVQFVGDGSFHFCNPDSALAVSRRYGLPVLSVVFDNGGWAAVKEATLRMYGSGFAQQGNDFESRLDPGVDFAQLAQAAGAHGERLEQPEQIQPALERAFAALRSGRAAVLQVAVGAH